MGNADRHKKAKTKPRKLNSRERRIAKEAYRCGLVDRGIGHLWPENSMYEWMADFSNYPKILRPRKRAVRVKA